MEKTEIEYLPNGLQLLQVEGQQKLGQDSILLAHFASPRRFSRILDLGCGTGALALGIFQPTFRIIGLDIQQVAIESFRESIHLNGLDERIQAVEGDLREIRKYVPHGAMDYAICNPPYFPQGCGKLSPVDTRNIARMEGEADIDQVAVALAFVLKSGGKCALVFRPDRLGALWEALVRVRLVPKRMRFVHQTVKVKPSAVLLECRKGAAQGLVVEPPLLIQNEDGSETDEYKLIYNKENKQ